jgi:hypothetical protein
MVLAVGDNRRRVLAVPWGRIEAAQDDIIHHAPAVESAGLFVGRRSFNPFSFITMTQPFRIAAFRLKRKVAAQVRELQR